MKRILQIVGTMDRAGAETMVMNLYKAIDRTKYQFEFVYFTEKTCSFDNEILALGGIIHRISEKDSNNPIKRTLKLYQLIRRNKHYHAVHCHQLLSNSFHLIAAYFAGIPNRIAHAHSTQDFSPRSKTRILYQKFSKTIISLLATNYIACGKAAGKFLFPEKNNITFIPNAIDVTKFIDAQGRKQNRASFFSTDKINSNTLVLSQIGRFMPVKNHIFSIEYAKYLKERKINFHMFFIGKGHLEKEMKLLVKKRGLTKNISFLGIRKDIDEVLAHTDVMLMPSIYEGFPVILVESQAAGTPALISDSISNEVDLGLNLIKFCSLENSFEIWHKSLETLKNLEKPVSKSRYKVLRQKGFDIETSVKKLEKIYN